MAENNVYSVPNQEALFAWDMSPSDIEALKRDDIPDESAEFEVNER